MTVITLSRELGSEGDRVATLVAERLGLRIVDRERLYRAASAAGVSESGLLELEMVAEENLVGRVLRSLQTVPPTPEQSRARIRYVPLQTSPLAGIFSPVLPPASIAIGEMVKMLNLVIVRRAPEGSVLFVGQAGQAVLRAHPGALHVRIVATMERRRVVLQEREGLSETAALRRLRSSDRSRAEYLRRFHNKRWKDPTNYHLVLNTFLLAPSAAANVIVAASKKMLADGVARQDS